MAYINSFVGTKNTMAILILENGYNDLVRSRIPLGEYFQSKGLKVHYACPKPERDIAYEVPMSRSSLAPLKLIKGFRRLNQIENKLSVDMLLSFRFIPNVLNYLASFSNKKVKRVAVITGLGYAFVSSNISVGSSIQRYLIKLFYRIASKRIQIVAQNPDDLLDLGVVKGKVVFGSGVDSHDIAMGDELETNSIKLLFVGRLLKSKGIQIAIDVFEQLRSLNPNASLTIAGTIDEQNPDSINAIELSQLRNKEGVNYLGFVENMSEVYSKCNILLFPSNYREGIPRVLIEGLKYGLTIVTKDMPGCKETVRGNGLLIKENFDVEDVVDYLSTLNASCLLKNKNVSIELFKKTFSSEVVYPMYLTMMK